MKPLVVWLIFGTRPEAIKMLPLVKSLQKDERFKPVVCITAQHREMLDNVMKLFSVDADIDLDAMTPGQNLISLSAKLIEGLGKSIETPPIGVDKPDYILVHGDTATTLAGALAGYYNQIPICHVEAGLRTNDLYGPFPEEGNRKITSCLTELNFAPTELAKNNLLKEGYSASTTPVVGNTVIDSLLWMKNQIKENPSLAGDMLSFVSELKEKYKRYILITCHRRESHGEGLVRICSAIKKLSETYPDTAFVFPVHPNPKTKGPVESLLGGIDSVKLIDPLDYAPFIYVMDNCDLVLTDSGGVQEEAPSLNKPVLVLRDVTERQEALLAGTVVLVGTNEEKIVETVVSYTENKSLYSKMAKSTNPYGDGNTGIRIIDILFEHHQKKQDKGIL